jgi:hypothetical protein
MFLLAVAPQAGPGFALGRPMGPPMGGPIEVSLVSAEPETSWDVFVDGRELCKTPCTQRIDPTRSLLMRERSGILSRTTKVNIANLAQWQTVGGVQVKAHSTSRWNLAGLSRLGGAFYGLIGVGFLIPCLRGGDKDDPFDNSDQYCTVSGITLGFGVGLFILGTYILDSPGRADTAPIATF